MRTILRTSFAVIVLAFLAWAFFFAREGTMHALGSFGTAVSRIFSSPPAAEEVTALRLRVKDLEQKLREANATSTAAGKYHYKIANVYSKYPYNDEGTLVVDVGSADGIKAGMPVMASEGVLLGKIIAVRRTQSEVITIFSPNWKSSAGIGLSGAKAVVEGGITPTLDLIPRGVDVKEGEDVVNLSPDYPFRAYLGTLEQMVAVPNDIWRRAELSVPYRFEELNTVLVVIDFP